MPYIIAVFIMLCGAGIGAMLMWFYMDNRVEFWQDKFMAERDLKNRLLKQNLESLDKQLRIFHDLRGAFEGKSRAGRIEDAD
jgi:hypothetical protein